MPTMKVLAAAIVAGLVAGCAGTYQQPTYERMSWAKMSQEEALAKCKYEVNQPGNAGSLVLCMRAYGWNRTGS